MAGGRDSFSRGPVLFLLVVWASSSDFGSSAVGFLKAIERNRVDSILA